MRWMPVAIALLLSSVSPARAQVSVGINIGIDVPVFPELVPVPGYPVYYAPSASANYFFYDGLYWVFVRDGWYASSWYDGPWHLVGPDYVPVYLLRVPVRYYRVPPPYFHAWRPDGPPRWGERYGPAWERRRAGWNRWDRRVAMRPAPLLLALLASAGCGGDRPSAPPPGPSEDGAATALAGMPVPGSVGNGLALLVHTNL